MQVTVAYSPGPRQVREWELDLPEGATAGDALVRCGLYEAFPQLRDQTASLSVWGRRVASTQVLRERDRLEVLRPLLVDPKVARRERFQTQGARTAGLFSRRKPKP